MLPAGFYSSPIIDQINFRAVITRLVRPLHGNALKIDLESMCKHQTIRFVSRSIDTRDRPRTSLASGKFFASVQQRSKHLVRGSAGADSPKLNVTPAASRFGACTTMAQGKSGKIGADP